MRVPVYERQIGVNGIPNARAGGVGGADAYGAGAGRALSDFGNTMLRIAEDIEDTKTLEAFNRFKRESFEYHEDPDKGLYNTRKLGGAQNLYRDADNWLGGKVEEYAGKMGSPRAAQNFRRMAENYRTQRGERNSRYEVDQIKAYRDGEAAATIQNGLNEIMDRFDDDAAVEAARGEMYQALELQTRGMGAEARQAAVADMENKIAASRLSKMIERDPRGAQEWFSANLDKFTGQTRAKAETALNDANRAYRMEGTRDALINAFGTDYQAAREYILDNFEGDEERQALSLYEGWYSDQQRIERQVMQDYINGWQDRIVNASSMEEAQECIIQSGADGMERVQLEKLAAQRFKPESWKENLLDWTQAYQEVTGGQIADVGNLYARWGGRLSEGTLKTLARMFFSGKAGGGPGGGSGGGGRVGGSEIKYTGYSRADAINGAVKQLGYNNKNEDGRRKTALFVETLNRELDAREKRQGQSLSPVEFNRLVEEMTKTTAVKLPGAWFKSDVPAVYVEMAKAQGFSDDGSGQLAKALTDENGRPVMGADGKQVVAIFDPFAQVSAPEALQNKQTPPDAPAGAGDAPGPQAGARMQQALPPIPERGGPVGAPSAAGPTPTGPKRMADGSLLADRLPRKPSRPAVPLPRPQQRQAAPVERGGGGGGGNANTGGASFETAVRHTLNAEGGYKAWGKSLGGKTNRGIIESTLNRAYKAGIVNHNNIHEVTEQDARNIYKTMYWDASRAGELPNSLATVYFDTVVISGPGGGASVLRATLKKHGVNVKGKGINDSMIAAVRELTSTPEALRQFCDDFLDERLERHKRQAARDKAAPLKGWTVRVNRLRKTYS